MRPSQSVRQTVVVGGSVVGATVVGAAVGGGAVVGGTVVGGTVVGGTVGGRVVATCTDRPTVIVISVPGAASDSAGRLWAMTRPSSGLPAWTS